MVVGLRLGGFYVAVFAVDFCRFAAVVGLGPVEAVRADPDEGFGGHARAGAAGGVEGALVGEEAVADHGDSRDHALCGGVLRVR